MRYKLLQFFLIIFIINVYHAQAVLIDKIIAVVNNDIITLTELNEILIPYSQKIMMSNYGQNEQKEMLDSLKNNILDKLIDDKLADEQIREANISIDKKEIDEEIERIKSQRLFTQEEFEKALIEQGTNIYEYRKKIKEQKLRFKLYHIMIKSKIVITDNDIKAYYDSHPEKYQPKKKYHLRSIVKTNISESSKDDLNKVLNQLNEKVSFIDLAKKYSDSNLASEGGDLGFYSLDELSEIIREAVKDLTDGQYTQIIETDVGYQILFVEKIQMIGGKELKDVKDEISELLFNEVLEKKYKAWLKNIRDKSYIKLLN